MKWILLILAILVATLVIFIWRGYLNSDTFSRNALPGHLAAQYEQALIDVNQGNLRNASLRLEYILSNNKEYPGAAEKLAVLQATLSAIPIETDPMVKITPTPRIQEIVTQTVMPPSLPLLPMKTPANSQMSTPKELATPRVTATPQDFELNNDDVISAFVRKSHPGVCPAINLVENPEPDFMPPPPAVSTSEVAAFPDTRSYYVSEIADNSDGTLRAAIACTGERCVDNVYVRNQQSGKVYLVNFGAEQGRPLQWLVWLNRDTFLIFQSFSPHTGLVAAIDFTHEKFVHYGMGFECMADKPEEP